MADPITWGLINIVKKGVKGVQTTLDGVKNSVDTLPEDVQTKLDAFEVTIDELKKNVEDTLSDVQETVENSPAGEIPSDLNSFSSSSKEDGIEVKYLANITTGGGVVDNQDVTVLTKGVMIRYSKESYPLTKESGVLAGIDEDIFTLNEDGSKEAKEKTILITGLTNGETYYISAFPYSNYNMFNEAAGKANNGKVAHRTKCQWTGTKGTLTVNVTQDYDYKPLGEYTATLTPTAGGDPVTKTQSGAATVVFSGLEAGQYTLSFSEVASFTKPSNQSVTVVAGQSKVLDLQYVFTSNLNDLSWEEIDKYAKEGLSTTIWSVGDTKDVNVNGETLTFEIVGFNHDDLSDGSGKATITFGMKHLMKTKLKMNEENTNDGSYVGSEMNTFVGTTFYNNLPSELKNIIKEVKKVTGNGGPTYQWSGTRTDNFKTWLFSEYEISGSQQIQKTEKVKSMQNLQITQQE